MSDSVSKKLCDIIRSVKIRSDSILEAASGTVEESLNNLLDAKAD